MRLRLLLPCLTCAFLLVTCSDSSDGPSGVGGPVEIAGGGCKDTTTNAAIDALGSTGSPKGKALSDLKKIFQTHCTNVQNFLKDGLTTDAGLESFRAMKSIIDNKNAPITESQAIAIEEAFCTLGGVECPPWGDVPTEDIDFYDAIAVGLESAPNTLNLATPLADLDGDGPKDDNFAVAIQIDPDKTVAAAITILEVASSFQGECHFVDNSEFVCAGGIFNLVLFPEDDVIFAAGETSTALGLAQEGPVSKVGVCEGSGPVLTEHDDMVRELDVTNEPSLLVCDDEPVQPPSEGLGRLSWRIKRFLGATPAWAGRGGAMFANSEYGGGGGERFCTISGHVDTTFDNNAEGVIVTVSGADTTAADTTNFAGAYGPFMLRCPNEVNLENGDVVGGHIFTILAEKQPGHPAFSETRDERLPNIVANAEVIADTFNFLLEP